MKRSEMLKKMLETSKSFHGEIVTKDFEIILIEAMLKTCEDNGMLPPIESFRTVHDLDLGVPEWEAENDD